MTDIIERAESFMFHTPYASLPLHMSSQLLKELKAARHTIERNKVLLALRERELKAARAENERMRESMAKQETHSPKASQAFLS